MEVPNSAKSIKITAVFVDDLTEVTVLQIPALFDAACANAYRSCLFSSFEVMDWIALAMNSPVLVGFAIGDAKIADLTLMNGLQPAASYGIGCIE